MDDASLEHSESSPNHTLSLRERFGRLPKFDLSNYRRERLLASHGVTANVDLYRGATEELPHVVVKRPKPSRDSFVMKEAELLTTVGKDMPGVVKCYGAVDTPFGYSLVEEALIPELGWTKVEEKLPELSNYHLLEVTRDVFSLLKNIYSSELGRYYEVTTDSLFAREGKLGRLEIKAVDFGMPLSKEGFEKNWNDGLFRLLTVLLSRRRSFEDHYLAKMADKDNVKRVIDPEYHGILDAFVASSGDRIDTTIKNVEETIQDLYPESSRANVSRPTTTSDQTVSQATPEAKGATVPDSEYIGLGEAARRLGMTRAELYNQAMNKKVQFIQFTPNSRILFDPNEIEKFKK